MPILASDEFVMVRFLNSTTIHNGGK